MWPLTRRNPWKAGVIYYDRKDPRIVVPNRFRVGWTLNMARPWAWALTGAFAAAVAVSRKK
jgi:uncharacterized membrane protein